MKAMISISLLAAAVVGVVIYNRQHTQKYEQLEVIAAPPLTQSTVVRFDADLAHTNSVLLTNSVPVAQTDALAVLQKYMPDATEEQKQAATHIVWHMRQHRLDWIKEANEIKQKLAELDNPDILPSAKADVKQVMNHHWIILMSEVKSVMEHEAKAVQSVYAKNGFTDPNLQFDLWSLAIPPGKENLWEE